MSNAVISRKEEGQTVTINNNYVYDQAGIRVKSSGTINGAAVNRVFLTESGFTGYAQILEETSQSGAAPIKSYVLGDDVLSQTVNGTTSHLMYDGHGSTRLLADTAGVVSNAYDFDAFGIMIGGNPTATNPAATDLLYSGEQYDCGLQMQYLRARYYDQNTGRFNALDPFAGNHEDPQSLHKYNYCHSDPVNGIDPSGKNLLLRLAVALVCIAIVLSLIVVAYLDKKERAEMSIIAATARPLGVDTGVYSTEGEEQYNWNDPLKRMEIIFDKVWYKNDHCSILMKQFASDVKSGKFKILICNVNGSNRLDKKKIGAFRLGNKAVISRTSIPIMAIPKNHDPRDGGTLQPISQIHILRLLLISFAEYQHSNLHPGGSFSEEQAQIELEHVRGRIPYLSNHPDYSEIMKIKHGK
jgi:RHS repeat-associated protein